MVQESFSTDIRERDVVAQLVTWIVDRISTLGFSGLSSDH